MLKQSLSFCILITFLSSCATSALWKATDPDTYVQINMEDVSEEELKAQGLHYRADYFQEVYYVEKSAVDRLKDYSLRAFGTPVTVVWDAATSIFVIGILAFVDQEEREFLERCEQDPACRDDVPKYRSEQYDYKKDDE